MTNKKVRLKAGERDRTNKSASCERIVREEIERLSNFKLKLVKKGVGVEVGYIEGVDLRGQVDDLDYAVEFNDVIIAWIDVSCLNWTFEDSKIMPVNAYKGGIIKKLNVPVFIVESMEKEQKAIKDRCVWIRGKDVIKSPLEWGFLGGKRQYNHMTDKNDWYRGLQSLVDKLLKRVNFKPNP